MCLIAWNWQPDHATPLLVVANRDEFYARPTQALQWWEDTPTPRTVLAGRDLQAGGTWLGVSRSGRLAALTNVRDPSAIQDNRPSRGALVSEFLTGTQGARAYLETLCAQAAHYNPFNLLVYDGQELLGLESDGAVLVEMQAGLGAVSNARFHTPWPKLVLLQTRLAQQLQTGRIATDELLPLLQDEQTAPDHALPHTGVPWALERALSATFITTPDYGTRASSVVRLGTAEVEFTEQRYDASGVLGRECQRFEVRTN